jgi:hypothetical protein
MGLGLAFAIVAGRRLNAIRNRIFDPAGRASHLAAPFQAALVTLPVVQGAFP